MSIITREEWDSYTPDEQWMYVNILFANHDRVLHAIPECPEHGDSCIPHALEWIDRMKEVLAVIDRPYGPVLRMEVVKDGD